MTDTPKPLTSAELTDLKAKASDINLSGTQWQPHQSGSAFSVTAKNGKRIFRHVAVPSSVHFLRARADVNFVAAANPETILRLIDMIERRDEQIEKLRNALKNIANVQSEANAAHEYKRVRNVAREALAATEPQK